MGTHSKKNILIVEDDNDINNMIHDLLRLNCIESVSAYSGTEALLLLDEHVDLVLLDLKHINDKDYKKMTGRSMDYFHEFLQALKKSKKPIWIRHVVVPGITDSELHMKQLQDYICQIPNVKKVELLPYHLLGTNKYKVMGIPYSLEGVPAMSKEKTLELQTKYFKGEE